MYLCPLDEAGPGPVKSKYDALDFDTLLKEAQKSMHRWLGAPDWPALVTLQQRPSDYTAPPTDRPLSTSMQGDLAKCLHFYHWNNETIRTVGLFSVFLSFFHRRILRFKKTHKKKQKRGSRWEVWTISQTFLWKQDFAKATTNANDTVLCWTTITKLSVLATSSPRLREEARETYVANSLLFLRWSSWRVFLRVRVLCSVCFIYKKEKRERQSSLFTVTGGEPASYVRHEGVRLCT